MNRWSQQTIFLKKTNHLTLISFIHSYFKGLWFYGVCDSFCLFAYLTYLVCWHVKCLKFSVSTCIYLFSWRQILNHFSFQKTGWGFSIYMIVSLIKSLTDDSAQTKNQWQGNVFFVYECKSASKCTWSVRYKCVLKCTKSCIVPWMILNICIWNKSYNRLISVMTVVVII